VFDASEELSCAKAPRVDVAAFDFELPPELIAQEPLPERDASRLLVLPRQGLAPDLQHRMVRDLPRLLRRGDLLVVNDARVIPARLRGHKADTGGKVELLLVEPLAAAIASQPPAASPAFPSRPDEEGVLWLAIGQASKPLRAGARITVQDATLTIVEARGEGQFVVRLPAEGAALWDFLDRAGELPLPPYIEHKPGSADLERYQTIYARERGAVAAPTAGLHFTSRLFEELGAAGVEIAPITLHVGPGTFLPVRAQRTEDHRMHRERYEVPDATAAAIGATTARGGSVIAVGTTALRTLEASGGRAGPGATDLFITPGYAFKVADGLFTNFHLPKSTLLMLVSSFAGLDRTLSAYREAVARRYRFFSYGDAMLIR
jgi:S-adenosylmethionine:tRNA ribosyltransferase-isomerase